MEAYSNYGLMRVLYAVDFRFVWFDIPLEKA